MFVTGFKKLYGSSYVSYNVHNLVHLPDDVLLFGNLDSFSAFPFESHMFKIKRMIRKGNKQLQQVVNRTAEAYQLDYKLNQNTLITSPILKMEYKNSKCYNKIEFSNFIIKIDERNKWFLTKNKQIYSFIKAFYKSNSIVIKCRQLKTFNSFFETPFNSSNILIFCSDGQLHPPSTISINDVTSKLFVMNIFYIPNKYYINI